MESLVQLNHKGQFVTNSLKVAYIFGKRHDHVLRDIQNLSCSEQFNLLNFGEIYYTDAMNRDQRAVEMTKDGFSFLVMGYTGEKAGQFKELFINEFNKRTDLLLNDEYILQRSREILDLRVKALEAQLSDRNAKLELQEATIQHNIPKVNYYDTLMKSDSHHTITTIGAQFNMSAVELNRLLIIAKIIRKTGREYSLTSRYQGMDITWPKTVNYEDSEGKKHTIIELRWKEKGREIIIQTIHRAIDKGVLYEKKGRYFVSAEWKKTKVN